MVGILLTLFGTYAHIDLYDHILQPTLALILNKFKTFFSFADKKWKSWIENVKIIFFKHFSIVDVQYTSGILYVDGRAVHSHWRGKWNPRTNFKFQASFFRINVLDKSMNPLLLTPSYRLNSRLDSLSLWNHWSPNFGKGNEKTTPSF